PHWRRVQRLQRQHGARTKQQRAVDLVQRSCTEPEPASRPPGSGRRVLSVGTRIDTFYMPHVVSAFRVCEQITFNAEAAEAAEKKCLGDFSACSASSAFKRRIFSPVRLKPDTTCF